MITTIRMIQPLPPTLLASNRQFAALHKTLTTKLLDPDASTKTTNTTHLLAEDQVIKHLIQNARQQILLQALQDLAIPDPDSNDENTLNLAPELRELIYIVSTSLLAIPPRTLTPTQAEILDGKIHNLTEKLPRILPALTHALIAQQSHLYALSTFTSTSMNQPGSSKLPNYTLHLHLLNTLKHLSALRTSLLTTETTLINQLTQLLTQHTTHLTGTLTHLSSHTHGTQLRHNLSRSSHQSTITSTLLSKLQVLNLEARRATYSPPTQIALANYSSHLDILIQELETRNLTLKDELRLYSECDGRGGETIRELARKYASVTKETEVVKGDVARLESSAGKGADGKERTVHAAKKTERKVSRRDWEIP